jgi:Rod binding domain-containing protein
MSLPPIDSSLLPADVRKGGPAAQQAYAAALGFERSLLEQLTKPLADSAQLGSDDEDAPAPSPYLDMLPGAMADGLIGQGGVGLADDLYRSLHLTPAAPAAGSEEPS